MKISARIEPDISYSAALWDNLNREVEFEPVINPASLLLLHSQTIIVIFGQFHFGSVFRWEGCEVDAIAKRSTSFCSSARHQDLSSVSGKPIICYIHMINNNKKIQEDAKMDAAINPFGHGRFFGPIFQSALRGAKQKHRLKVKKGGDV